jgi:SAM-dependent methyltransferase
MAFVTGDVHALDLPDDSFDVVHAHQVLQHVADPVAALREMRRVCKPGGIVAARDGDYAGFTWYPELPELEEWRALYSRAARANGGEPDAGRRLLSWAQAAGFSDITTSASAWCYATPETRAYWGGGWADRMTESQIATQCVRDGLATADDLQRIAEGWRRWAAAEDGWVAVLHGEIICRA